MTVFLAEYRLVTPFKSVLVASVAGINASSALTPLVGALVFFSGI